MSQWGGVCARVLAWSNGARSVKQSPTGHSRESGYMPLVSMGVSGRLGATCVTDQVPPCARYRSIHRR